jgi:hypothetical protein
VDALPREWEDDKSPGSSDSLNEPKGEAEVVPVPVLETGAGGGMSRLNEGGRVGAGRTGAELGFTRRSISGVEMGVLGSCLTIGSSCRIKLEMSILPGSGRSPTCTTDLLIAREEGATRAVVLGLVDDRLSALSSCLSTSADISAGTSNVAVLVAGGTMLGLGT